MFNGLKRQVIQEVINELQDLCIEHDAKIEVKNGSGEDVTFEAGIGSGLRQAIGRAYNIKNKYN